jgi:oxygen-dependent protoporphyrinogen oxidase
MKIAIVGGGLSGLSAAYQAQQDGLEFSLFEASGRFGGVIETLVGADAAVLEGGAESCLSSKPEMLELVRALGLEDEVVPTVPENLGSFIVRDGLLHPIPKGLRLIAPSLWWPFLKSGVLSWRGKLRAMLDLFLPARDLSLRLPEESLADFVTRRLGAEVLHYLAQPMVAGIYGADPQCLSLEATMPLFSRLEQEHGSVIRGLRKMATESEATGARYNLFFSLRRGFGSVVEALVQSLPEGQLQLGSRVDQLEKLDPVNGGLPRWRVGVRGREPELFDAVVLAVPAPVAASLLASTDQAMARSLAEIKYRPAVTVNLSYDPEIYDAFVPKGYGFVVPTRERRPLLACTFSTRKWPGRGSDDRGVLRTYFGGPGMEWAMKASDEDLIAVSESQLGELLGLYEPALDASVHRYPLGLPEYRIGHRQRIQGWYDALEVHSTLMLAGNYLDGVGMPDSVRAGRKAIRKLRSL